jgi:ring-1,2-phenylacetyl-CoA epoxidase subunit PaaE
MNELLVIPAAVVAAGAAWFFLRAKGGSKKAARKEEPAHEWTVTTVTKETPSTVSFEVDQTLDFKAGQFVLLRPNKELPWRAYSFSRAPGQPLRLTVKRVEKGAVSTHVTEKLAAGDLLEVKGPYGQFVLPEGAKHALLLAGGSGVTPMLSFLHDQALKGWPTKVTLIDANRTEAEQILRSELDELVKKSDGKLTVVHVLDDATEGLKGPMTEDVVEKVLEGVDAPDVVALCGPGPMMDACKAVTTKKYPSAKLLEEKFTQITAQIGADAIAHEVEVVEDDRSRTFTVREGEPVLQAARRAKIDLLSGCEAGVCGSCRVKMRRGTVDTPEESCLTQEEREEGYALICIGTVKGPCSFEPAP